MCLFWLFRKTADLIRAMESFHLLGLAMSFFSYFSARNQGGYLPVVWLGSATSSFPKWFT